MREWKTMKLLLGCMAAASAAVCSCLLHHIVRPVYSALYFFSVLIPLTGVIIFQHISLKKYIKAVSDREQTDLNAAKKHIRFSVILNDMVHTIAALKGEGIDPCRAGPFTAFAWMIGIL